MKKVIGILLTLALVISISAPSFATTGKNKKLSIEEAVERIQEMYPNSEIRVDEHEVIHILNNEPISSNRTNMATRSITYAPDGGSYRSFTTPSWWSADAGIPYSIMFIPANKTTALLVANENSSVFELIKDNLVALGVDTVIAQIATLYGVQLTAAQVYFLSGILLYSMVQAIDHDSLVGVLSQYDKVSIIRESLYGYTSNIYSGWTGDYVSPDPYDDFNPTFYNGVYDF